MKIPRWWKQFVFYKWINLQASLVEKELAKDPNAYSRDLSPKRKRIPRADHSKAAKRLKIELRPFRGCTLRIEALRSNASPQTSIFRMSLMTFEIMGNAKPSLGQDINPRLFSFDILSNFLSEKVEFDTENEKLVYIEDEEVVEITDNFGLVAAFDYLRRQSKDGQLNMQSVAKVGLAKEGAAKKVQTSMERSDGHSPGDGSPLRVSPETVL